MGSESLHLLKRELMLPLPPARVVQDVFQGVQDDSELEARCRGDLSWHSVGSIVEGLGHNVTRELQAGPRLRFGLA
jgi:hypothetical protein